MSKTEAPETFETYSPRRTILRAKTETFQIAPTFRRNLNFSKPWLFCFRKIFLIDREFFDDILAKILPDSHFSNESKKAITIQIQLHIFPCCELAHNTPIGVSFAPEIWKKVLAFAIRELKTAPTEHHFHPMSILSKTDDAEHPLFSWYNIRLML